jgi:hypothetical protein
MAVLMLDSIKSLNLIAFTAMLASFAGKSIRDQPDFNQTLNRCYICFQI